MEEDIKILEEKIKIIESLCTDDCINKSTVIKPLKYALENLLTRYKQLEEENKRKNVVKRSNKKARHRNKQIKTRRLNYTGNHIPQID